MGVLVELRAVGFLPVSNSNYTETKKTNPKANVNEVVINTLSCQTASRKLDFFIIEEDKIVRREIGGVQIVISTVSLKPVTHENIKNEELESTDQLAVIVSEGDERFILADPRYIEHWHNKQVSVFCCEKAVLSKRFDATTKTKGLKICPQQATEIIKAFIQAKVRLGM